MLVFEVFENNNLFRETYGRGSFPKNPLYDWIPTGSSNPVQDLFDTYQADASFSTREKARLECSKYWNAAKILFTNQASFSAVALAQKVFKFAKKYEFTDFLLEISNTLSLFYGTIAGEQKQYEYFRERSDFYEGIWKLEMKVESCYAKLKIKTAEKNILQTNFIREADQCTQDLAQLMRNHTSHDLHWLGRLYQVDLLLLKGHSLEATQACDEAVHFFETKKYETEFVVNFFMEKKSSIVG